MLQPGGIGRRFVFCSFGKKGGEEGGEVAGLLGEEEGLGLMLFSFLFFFFTVFLFKARGRVGAFPIFNALLPSRSCENEML